MDRPRGRADDGSTGRVRPLRPKPPKKEKKRKEESEDGEAPAAAAPSPKKAKPAAPGAEFAAEVRTDVTQPMLRDIADELSERLRAAGYNVPEAAAARQQLDYRVGNQPRRLRDARRNFGEAAVGT